MPRIPPEAEEIAQIKATLRAEFPELSIICGRPCGRWFAFSGPVPLGSGRRFVDIEAATHQGLREKLLELLAVTRHEGVR